MPRIGESERVYIAGRENTEVRGLAWDESSADAPRLFVLDRSGKVFVYRANGRRAESMQLELLRHVRPSLRPSAGWSQQSARARVCRRRQAGTCSISWTGATPGAQTLAVRRSTARTTSSVDLSLAHVSDRRSRSVRPGLRDGSLLVSFDASGYADQNLRVQRGILRIEWDGAFGEDPASVRHLPDAGTLPSHGLATMDLDGAGYLWATVGNDHVYCAERGPAADCSSSTAPSRWTTAASCWGLCFGRDALWVSENVPGPIASTE